MLKPLLIIFISLSNFTFGASCDTLAYWHIIESNDTLELHTGIDGVEVKIDTKEIKLQDSLSTQVWYCVGLIGIKYIAVLSKNSNVIAFGKAESIHRSEAIKISLYDLLEYSLKSGEKEFDLYYAVVGREIKYQPNNGHLLARIVLY
ncbi:MAG: hypothetical protein ACI8ZM_001760 [Crocinitomix sp.]|jgi:hypothetical protein